MEPDQSLPGPAAPTPVHTRRPIVVAAIAGGLALLALCCAGTVTVLFVQRDRIFGGARGSTTITVQAVGRGNTVAGPELLEQTRRALSDRAEAAGLADPSVTLSGDQRIVVRVSGADQADELRALVAVGELRFRQVLATAVESSAGAPTGTPPVPIPGTGPLPTREQVIGKLGPAYGIAQSLTRTLPPPAPLDATTRHALAPFAALSPAEVAVLPAEVQYAVPTVTCAQLLARPVEAPGSGDQRLTACDRSTPANRYLLDAAPLSGADVDEATARFAEHGQWVVGVSFTPTGQQRWTELTRAASTGTGGTNQVAIVVDDQVVSAPTVQGVLTGSADISGGFTRATATELAAQLSSGALPVALRIVALTTDPD